MSRRPRGFRESVRRWRAVNAPAGSARATWYSMRQRCGNSKHTKYRYYGARGVRVCEAWNDSRTGFAAFLRDMGPRPAGTSIDRIDPTGNYESSNCRWADRMTQAHNRRHVQLVCRTCEIPFTATTTQAMYCSKACGRRASRAYRPKLKAGVVNERRQALLLQMHEERQRHQRYLQRARCARIAP